MAEAIQFKRWSPRRKLSLPCWVNWQERQVQGKTVDISYGGVGVVLPEAVEWTEKEIRVQIAVEIGLRVRAIYLQESVEGYRVGCKIEVIERGKKQWARLCDVPRW